MTNFERVTRQVESIKSTTDTWFTGKELKEIPNIIHEDENVVYFTSGHHKSNNNTMVIILTDKRVIFLDKGMFVSRQQFDISLDMINSVQSYMGIMLGRLTIIHGAHSEIIENVDKSTAKNFQELATKQIETFKKQTQNRQANMFAEAMKNSSIGNSNSSSNKFLKIENAHINCNHIVNINLNQTNLCIVTSEIENGKNKKYIIQTDTLDTAQEKIEAINSFMQIEILKI
ncbi:MAG: PH domain-containing protein [Fusobacteriaceae bacterium]